MKTEPKASIHAGTSSKQYKTASQALQYQLPQIFSMATGPWKRFGVRRGERKKCSRNCRYTRCDRLSKTSVVVTSQLADAEARDHYYLYYVISSCHFCFAREVCYPAATYV